MAEKYTVDFLVNRLIAQNQPREGLKEELMASCCPPKQYSGAGWEFAQPWIAFGQSFCGTFSRTILENFTCTVSR